MYVSYKYINNLRYKEYFWEQLCSLYKFTRNIFYDKVTILRGHFNISFAISLE